MDTNYFEILNFGFHDSHSKLSGLSRKSQLSFAFFFMTAKLL